MVGFDSGQDKRLSARGHGAAGMMSGILTRYLTQPLDVLKIRFQLQHEPLKAEARNYYWNMRQAASRILREESYRALWKGHVPAQLLSAVYGLTQFQTFEFLTEVLEHENAGVKKPLIDLLCGGVSGAVGTLASMPCDTIRTRLVSQGEPKIYRGIIDAGTSMVRHEGFFSLYKGLVPSLLQIVPQTGIQFASFRLFSEFYWILRAEPKESKLPLAGNLICGCFAGLVAKVAVYPLDLGKKRLQIQGFEQARLPFGRVAKYSGLLHCLRLTFEGEGLRGMYKGLGPSTVKAMVTTSLTFTLYEEFSALFLKLDLFVMDKREDERG